MDRFTKWTIGIAAIGLLLIMAVLEAQRAALPLAAQSQPSLGDEDYEAIAERWLYRAADDIVVLVHPYCSHSRFRRMTTKRLGDGRCEVSYVEHYRGNWVGGGYAAVISVIVGQSAHVEEWIWDGSSDSNWYSPRARNGTGSYLIHQAGKIVH
jgi:hypothetical protein